MANAWIPKNQLKQANATVGASETNLAISENFSITAGGSKHLVVSIECSGVTVAVGITAKLQSATNAGSSFEDAKTVAITGNDTFYIKFDKDVDTDLLLSVGRVVITTGAGDAVTIDALNIIQEL